MEKINILGTDEKLVRDLSVRESSNRELNKIISKKFDFEYFDGSRDQGYGGYYYDGRWVDVARRIIERYQLPVGGNFLDVGCAKGFLLHDLKTIRPDLNVFGLDISAYALEKSLPTIQKYMIKGNCINLPYEDKFFDAVVCINTVHNLDYERCKIAISELIRVSKNKKNIFIQVDSYTSENELDLFKKWVLTAETYLKPEEWLDLFADVKFKGDYFWTIIGFEKG
tara:strand:- start:3189 stop:3863 length:675 start_codon:yes stop_codon:yes gene_type:complete